jgi:hypothetical protein
MTVQSADFGRLSLLSRSMSGVCAIRVVVLCPGGRLVFDECEWRDCLAEVERGDIELQFRDGSKRECETGDVLWLVGLPIVALHNSGSDLTVLVAISRRRADQTGLESTGN